MKIGFTGTRKRMTDAQKLTVEIVLCGLPSIHEVHHGCCIGADEQFHEIAENHALKTVGWPSFAVGQRYRADVNCTVPMPISPIWSRNRKIASLDVLIAAPAEFDEQPTGGTWGTLRIAREPKLDRPRVIVYPDGTAKWEKVVFDWQPWQDCLKVWPPDHAVELLFNDYSIVRDVVCWDDDDAVYYCPNYPHFLVTHWREFQRPILVRFALGQLTKAEIIEAAKDQPELEPWQTRHFNWYELNENDQAAIKMFCAFIKEYGAPPEVK